MSMTFLYRYETKGIQKWILDSGRLRELAGGSALIEDLVAEAERRVTACGGTVVQAAAGGLAATFDSDVAMMSFASEWPMFVGYAAPGLQVVQGWVNGDDTRDCHNQLRRLLAEKRNFATPELPEVGPWVARAGRSGRPAVPVPPAADRRPHKTKLDRAGVARERARLRLASRGNQSPFGRFDVETDGWGEGPIAVLHIDGNGIGKRIADPSSGPVAAFSEALTAATNHATRAAVATLPETRQNERRGRLVVVGGDDVTAVVPAVYARRFVETWIREFEAATKPAPLSGLTASAGIAYTNAHFPFSRAYELAEGCTKRAKAAGRTRSRLSFVRVTTALEDDLDRSGVWEVTENGTEMLTALVAAARLLPRGTLRQWLTLHQHDAAQNAERDAAWNRMKEVANKDAWSKFAAALSAAGADPGTGTYGGSGTPIYDVLTIRHLEPGPLEREEVGS